MARKKRKKKKGSGGGRPGRPPRLENVSFEELQAEMVRRREQADELRARRDELQSEIDELDKQLAAFGADGGRRGGRRGAGRGGRRGGRKKTSSSGPKTARGRRASRTRARNTMSLAEALRKVLDGKTLSVTEATEAVKEIGYQSSSPNFRLIVNQALLSNDDFKKVARGQYTLKKSA